MNEVTFFLSADRRGETEYITAKVVTPTGKQMHVGYHPHIDGDGQRSGIGFAFEGEWYRGSFFEKSIDEDQGYIWLEDKDGDDMFASELFQQLTGYYPYEVEEGVKPNQGYAPIYRISAGST